MKRKHIATIALVLLVIGGLVANSAQATVLPLGAPKPGQPHLLPRGHEPSFVKTATKEAGTKLKLKPASSPGDPSISATPSPLNENGNLTVSFANSSPTSADWLAVFDSNWNFLGYAYDNSCTTTAGSGALSSGSCSWTVTGWAPDTYNWVLGTGSTELAATTGTIVAPPTLTASPSSAAQGSQITLSWSGVAPATTTDWLGLFLNGDTYEDYLYDNSCGHTAGSTTVASGSCTYTIPTSIPTGTYTWAFFSGNGNVELTSLGNFTVTGSGAQGMAVPAYFYPGPYWTQVDQAAPTLRLAVMNPDSGPGSAPDPNYVSAVQVAQAAGITVVGYVYTSYGSRSLSAVESDVNAYYSWYGVNGIFFDEASTNCAYSSYYATLNAFVKAKGGTARTILNPGTRTNQCYVPDADILLTFEGSDTQYVNSYSAPSWVASYSPTHFWHVIYDTSTASAMTQAVQLSKQRDAGFVYVTPDTLPNPWDTLPTGSYWTDELAAIG